MNILPKKRWHVRTKDNIARVRRDEAQAAEEEKQRVHRAKLAEQEARTALLRTKARQSYDGGYGKAEAGASATSAAASNGTANTTATTQVADIYTAAGNINFFKDLEEGKQTDGKNEEYEKEKKEEQEKYEKSIGYLTYLGQDSIEAQGKKAWYEEAAGRTTFREDEGEGEELQEVGLKSKDKLDPIHDIIKYGGIKPIKKVPGISKTMAADDVLTTPKQNTESKGLVHNSKITTTKKRKHRHKDSNKKKKKTKKSRKRKQKDDDDDDEDRRAKRDRQRLKRKRYDSSDEDNRSRKRRKTDNHKRKSREPKRSKKHCHSNRSGSSSSTTSTDSSYESSEDEEAIQEKKKKLEILRAERLKREAEERKRANRLLAGKKPDASDDPPKQPTIQQKYNTQFNPQIARQNQEQRTLEAGVKYWLQ